MGFELRNDKVKKGTGSGSKNVTWTYVGGDEKTANIRTAEITTTTPGSGFAGTGVGYAESFAKLTPAQKIEYNTPDIKSYKKYVIDFNKLKYPDTTTETITQTREDWEKTTTGFNPDTYDWVKFTARLNTGNPDPEAEPKSFTPEQMEKSYHDVGGYRAFVTKIKSFYPWALSYGKKKAGSSTTTTTYGKTAFATSKR
jgi:hypothetical protein